MMIKDLSSVNAFVDNHFNRLGEKRKNTAWVAQQLAAEDSVFVPVWKHRCATDGKRLRFASRQDFPELEELRPILLGRYNDRACFAIDVGQKEQLPAFFAEWEFHGLRTIGMTFAADEAALAAYAQAMVFWQRNHLYCGQCGSLSSSNEAGHMLDCINPQCSAKSFPRSDPAIIVLATDNDRVLMGRQANWPAGRYSTIAGFVEPGESLEAAVRREVAEETGHIASDVQYYSSQPWPFPSSLMLGFLARVSAQPHTEPDDELEDVRWFTRDEITQRTRHGPQLLPPRLSIAYRLVEYWFNLDCETPLENILPE